MVDREVEIKVEREIEKEKDIMGRTKEDIARQIEQMGWRIREMHRWEGQLQRKTKQASTDSRKLKQEREREMIQNGYTRYKEKSIRIEEGELII